MGTSLLWGHQLCPADPFRFIPPRKVSRPFPGSPTAGGTFSATSQGKQKRFFPPFCWCWSRLRQQRHPRSLPWAGLEPATAAQAWLEHEQLGQPGERGRERGRRMEEAETATCTCFRGERDFSSRICQGNRDTTELLCNTGISSRTVWVLAGWGGVREKKCGMSILDWKGSQQILRDLFSTVGGGKRASVTEQGWSCWNRGKSPSHAHHEPPGERRDCCGQWEGRGRCWE